MRIFEIFPSISGEVGHVPQGTPTTFVRFAGCNLRCPYCDTKQALDPNSGTEMITEEAVQKIRKIGLWHILFTGGEPLLQQEAIFKIIEALDDDVAYCYSIETNGMIRPSTKLLAMPAKWISPISWIVDFKLPSSKVKESPYKTILNFPKDSWFKFVCSDRMEVIEAVHALRELQYFYGYRYFAFSAAFPKFTTAKLWKILIGKYPEILKRIVINVQLHKFVGLS